MNDLETESLLRTNLAQMRALLDLSYTRERALKAALEAMLDMSDGAAIAPAKAEMEKPARELATAALAALQQRPLLNHGLLLDYLRMHVALSSAQGSMKTLKDTNRMLHQTCANLGAQLDALQAELRESNVARLALTKVLDDEPLAARVQSIAMQLVQQQHAPKPADESQPAATS